MQDRNKGIPLTGPSLANVPLPQFTWPLKKIWVMQVFGAEGRERANASGEHDGVFQDQQEATVAGPGASSRDEAKS